MSTRPRKVIVYLADLHHKIDYFSGGGIAVPLNIGYIGAFLQKQIQNVEIELFKFPQDLIKALAKKTPHFVGLSNYLWNKSINNFMLKLIKKNNPNTYTVMGGPNIRETELGLEEFLKENSYLDFYTPAMGEVSFSLIVKQFIKNNTNSLSLKDGGLIPGIAYIYNDHLCYIKAESFPGKELDYIPSPYLSGLLDKFFDQDLVPLIETNRGCPFSCTFCVWGIASKSKITYFSEERVYKEFDYVIEKSKISPYWIIADANFGINPRDVEFAAYLANNAKHKTEQFIIWWSKNTTKNNIMIADVLGDRSTNLIAFQSFDPDVLKHIKRTNISQKKLRDFIPTIKNQILDVDTDILIGLTGQSLQSHLNDLKAAFECGFDHIYTHTISLLPGSEMESDSSRKEFDVKTSYRLLDGCYGLYNGEFVFELDENVVSTRDMSFEEMMFARKLNWLIWSNWTQGYLKLPLKYIRTTNYNIVDFFEDLIKKIQADKKSILSKLFKQYAKNAIEEWFTSRQEANLYFSNKNNYKQILNGGINKLNPQFLLKLFCEDKILDIYKLKMIETLNDHFSIDEESSFKIEIFEQLFDLSCQKIFFLDILNSKNIKAVKQFEVNTEMQEILYQLIPNELSKKPLDSSRKVVLSLDNERYKNYLDYVEKFSSSADYIKNKQAYIFSRFKNYLYNFEHIE
jgi:radical SAM superfamily enzyme YgiQ (UPF0313 family)